MKKIIDKKRYNTETAELIAEWSNNYYSNDFKYCEESLYLTKKGTYFIHGSGGPMTKYAVSYGNSSSGGETIILVSKEESIEWCEQRQLHDTLEKHFTCEIEEG